ncbi:MAG TPA: hypothetical protein VK879_19885 [Candidatus Sulfomarinibacteraceae bacterium]|nr:hypothetical protein [Candidatus Sulfomarinibacteraceae bacterium]
MSAHTQFEPDVPGTFEGLATVDVVEPGGAPAAIIDTDDAFTIEVHWETKGWVPPLFDGLADTVEWQVTAYLEALGSGADMTLGTESAKFNAGAAPAADQRDYDVSIAVAGSTVPAGAYRLITVILGENTATGVKQRVAAFVDGPTLQFFQHP